MTVTIDLADRGRSPDRGGVPVRRAAGVPRSCSGSASEADRFEPFTPPAVGQEVEIRFDWKALLDPRIEILSPSFLVQ